MTHEGSVGSVRLSVATADEQVLDHYVSGFEWSVPAKIDLIYPLGEPPPVLTWTVDPEPIRVHAAPGLLEDFLKLERERDDQAILAYARRWGPLWLCSEHWLPFTHDKNCGPTFADWELPRRPDDPPPYSAEYDFVDDEPLDTYFNCYEEEPAAWRLLVRCARATVRLARALHNRQAGQTEDWDAIPFLPEVVNVTLAREFDDAHSHPFTQPTDNELRALDPDEDMDQWDSELDELEEVEDSPFLPPSATEPRPKRDRLFVLWAKERLKESTEFRREVVAGVLNHWLSMAAVKPRLDWSGNDPVVQLGGHGLVGALAVQLLFECSRTDGLAVCTSCGTPFLPARRPRRDRNTYCSDCGLKAAARDAAARYRRTQKYQATYQQWLKTRRT